MTDTATRGRGRTTRGRINDERVLDAAVTVIAEKGVDAFSLRDVAAAAGLTYGALYARYGNSRELLADVWRRRYLSEFKAMAEAALVFARQADPEIDWQQQTVGPATVGMLECLIASARVGELGDVVPSDVQTALGSLGFLEPAPNPLRLGVLGMLIGAAMHNEGEPTPVTILTRRELLEGEAPAPLLPGVLRISIPGQPQRQMLMQATLEIIIRSGIQGVNLRRISRVSGYSHNVVYSVYGGLEGLLKDVVTPGRLPAPPERLVGRYTDPIESAARVAGWTQPNFRDMRRLLLEFRIGTIRDLELSAQAAAVDYEIYRSVAALVDSPGTERFHRVVSNARNFRNLVFGASMLAEVGVDLSAIDWRPLTRSLIELD